MIILNYPLGPKSNGTCIYMGQRGENGNKTERPVKMESQWNDVDQS